MAWVSHTFFISCMKTLPAYHIDFKVYRKSLNQYEKQIQNFRSLCSQNLIKAYLYQGEKYTRATLSNYENTSQKRHVALSKHWPQDDALSLVPRYANPQIGNISQSPFRLKCRWFLKVVVNQFCLSISQY
jgi:hypothetical protein